MMMVNDPFPMLALSQEKKTRDSYVIYLSLDFPNKSLNGAPASAGVSSKNRTSLACWDFLNGEMVGP